MPDIRPKLRNGVAPLCSQTQERYVISLGLAGGQDQFTQRIYLRRKVCEQGIGPDVVGHRLLGAISCSEERVPNRGFAESGSRRPYQHCAAARVYTKMIGPKPSNGVRHQVRTSALPLI